MEGKCTTEVEWLVIWVVNVSRCTNISRDSVRWVFPLILGISGFEKLRHQEVST
jgi:hypothetical protein